MPSRQHHRGCHPTDARLFAPEWLPVLREAVADLSFLLTRGYSDKAALKLVGDHYQLAVRQRRAVLAAACPDASLQRRRETELEAEALAGRRVYIDGYNLLITIESALSGGLLFKGRDGCLRDLASVHGSYRKVTETRPAMAAIAAALNAAGVREAHWLFDAPVSNSGRLKTLLRLEAEWRGWPWTVELADGVDQQLKECGEPVITADGSILDAVRAWCNLTARIVSALDDPVFVRDLRPASGI